MQTISLYITPKKELFSILEQLATAMAANSPNTVSTYVPHKLGQQEHKLLK